jgi:predicted NBD/HSP70 family sugar kinase
MSRAEQGESLPKDQTLRHLGGGANQVGARAYNERLTLSLIRRNGPLPKAELARLTGLSAQTLSQIVRRLEADGLVVPQERVRGRIGQPSVPYALNPEGALSFGIKIGRRSTDIVLCDFLGQILDRARSAYPYPVPDDTLAFISRQIEAMRKRNKNSERLIGIGIAMPFDIWEWAGVVNAPQGSLDGWREMDAAAAIAERTGLPTMLANDATAACGAELGRIAHGPDLDFLYFFVGSFIGGGVVLNGALYSGRTGNAGALGSMPVFVGGQVSQLIRHASIITLEKSLLDAGVDAAILQHPERDWSGLGSLLARWIATAGEALAIAIAAGMSVIDFPAVRIDGALPRDVLSALIASTQEHLGRLDLQGLSPFEVVAGSIGADARALGGAMLPILANFSSDPEVLLKDVGGTATRTA